MKKFLSILVITLLVMTVGIMPVNAAGEVTLGEVTLTQDANDNLILTVEATGEDIGELEVDHSLEGQVPEFSVEAKTYTATELATKLPGGSVVFEEATNTWTINFGSNVSELIRSKMPENREIIFYFVIKDAQENILFGSMYPPTDLNTRTLEVPLTSAERIEAIELMISNLVDPSTITWEAIAADLTILDGFNAISAKLNELTEAEITQVSNIDDYVAFYNKIISLFEKMEFTAGPDEEKIFDFSELSGVEDLVGTLTFNMNDKDGKLAYSWVFTELSLVGLDETEIDLTISNTPSDAIKAKINGLVGNEKVAYIHFNHHGALPGKATIKVYVGDKYNAGDKISIYYYNEATGKGELVKEEITVDENGYITFDITHCSDYYVTGYKNPYTGIENINTYVLAGISFIGLAGIVYSVKSKKK